MIQTDAERRTAARQAILEAFAERPLQIAAPVIEHEVIALDDAELKSDDS